MSLQPFNKSNCLAMLNTLYPPVNAIQPTAQLTKEVLATQRNGFFRYIQNVERAGPALLRALIDQGKAPDHETGWTNVRDTVDRYLRAANAIIDECYEILGRDSLASPPTPTEIEIEEQRSRKVDSGISFNSSKRGSARTSTSTSASAQSKEKISLTQAVAEDSTTDQAPKPAGSTLERIAREIRRIRSRGDIGEAKKREKSRSRGSENDLVMTEEAAPPMPTQKEKKLRLKPSLKKMRSVSALGERDRNISSSGSSFGGPVDSPQAPEFDVDEMRRRRKEYEARQKSSGSFDTMEI